VTTLSSHFAQFAVISLIVRGFSMRLIQTIFLDACKLSPSSNRSAPSVSYFYSAAALLAMQSAAIPTAIPSVRPSHDGTLSRRMNIGSRGVHCEVAKHSSFLIPTMVGGRRPLPPKICAQSDPAPSKMRRLRPISAYNISTVRDSKKSSTITNRKSTTRFPTSYR